MRACTGGKGGKTDDMSTNMPQCPSARTPPGQESRRVIRAMKQGARGKLSRRRRGGRGRGAGAIRQVSEWVIGIEAAEIESAKKGFGIRRIAKSAGCSIVGRGVGEVHGCCWWRSSGVASGGMGCFVRVCHGVLRQRGNADAARLRQNGSTSCRNMAWCC